MFDKRVGENSQLDMNESRMEAQRHFENSQEDLTYWWLCTSTCTSGHEWEILSLSKGNIECFLKRGADGSSQLDKALVCEVNSCWCIDLITHLVYEVNMLLFWLSLGAVVTKDHYNSWDWEEVMLPIKCSCNTLTRRKTGALVWFGQSPPGYCVLFPLLLLLWCFRIIKLQAQESPGLLIWFCLFPHPDFLNIFLMKMRFCIKSLKQTVRPHPAAPPRPHWA